MWTFKKPYSSQELTKDYIDRRGKIALSRALNIGRVVGFVGSGATSGYGRKSWDDLMSVAVEKAKELAENSAERDSPSVKSAVKTLERKGKNKTLALGLAENLAFEVGESNKFRTSICQGFSGKRNDDGKKIGEFYRKAQPLRRLISDLRVNRLLTLNYDTEIEEEFRRLYRSGGTSNSDVDAREPNPQPMHMSGFDVLCSGDEDHFLRALDLPRRVEYSDGTTRSVLSVSMSPNNIGDLVNFALQPRQFVGQVFHLHGRFDKPDDIVLTDADYRRTYLKSDAQAQTFQEALTALMSGNDILFVGIGMKEDDLLRPLRQFVSQDKTPEFAQRHIFAMMENSVSLDYDWLRDPTGNPDIFKDQFSTLHLGIDNSYRPEEKGAVQTDYDADEEQSVRLRTEFGVYTLYHGGPALRLIRIAVKLLKDGIAVKLLKDDIVISTNNPFKTNKLCAAKYKAAILALKEAVENLVPPPDEIGIPSALLNKGEFARLLKILKNVSKLQKLADNGVSSCYKNELTFLESEIRSRALELALLKHEERREDWWQEWRKAPKARDGEYRRHYHQGDTNSERPCVARHRPVYKQLDQLREFAPLRRLQALGAIVAKETQSKTEDWVAPGNLKGGYILPFDTNTLSYFDSQTSGTTGNSAQRDFQKVPPKRILRVAMPRGYGKGSLLHILQQDIPNNTGFVLDRIFDQGSAEKPFKYHGSFCLHLSFSMEFSSVINALNIFIEQAMIGVFVEYPEKVLDCAKRLEGGGERNTFLDFLYRRMKGDEKATPCPKLGGISLYDRLVEFKDDKDNKNKEIKASFANQLSEFFEENHWDVRANQVGIGRMHRLEELRGRISAFTDIVDLLKDQNIRLFIAMSGLDKLCDNDGVAHNPMYRALFRLLTGCGAKYQSESDITSPMDFLLLSGMKNKPIRYLSEEFTKGQLEEKLKRPVDSKNGDYYASYPEFRKSYGEIYLQDWADLPPIAISERYWFEDESKAQKFLTTLKKYEDLEKKGEQTEFREIVRACQNGVALSSWCAGAYQQAGDENGAGKLEVKKYLQTLNAAAARGDIAMVLTEILEVHKVELRAWGQVLSETINNPDPPQEKWPQKELFAKRSAMTGIYEDKANRLVDLTYLILSHLALFPMPIESRILLNCGEIRDVLKQICTPQEGPVKQPALHSLLNQVLDYLRESHLIIAVHGKSQKSKIVDLQIPEGTEAASDDIHRRFTIQHQLRDFATRLMDLSVPDQGERNFFQVSVYCDQPRDLPSPRPEHYRLVRSIMEKQIKQSRIAIWSLMQLSREFDTSCNTKFDQLEPDFRNLAETGLQNVFCDPLKAQEIDGKLPEIHAVPQQIRALYGLMRSGFSIGTISRLPEINDRELDQPYERFRGWLRGLTNAALGWDYVLNTLIEDAKGDTKHQKLKKTLTAAGKINGIDAVADMNSFISNCRGFARPFYRDEIGWLLNERGLISLVQGHIFDALPLFQRALDEMHHDDSLGVYDPSLHAAVRRVRLNMAIALIDRGHLDRASVLLHGLQLPDDFSAHNGSMVSWLAQGYLGLIHHLSGNFELAELSYRNVVRKAQERELMRVVGIFSKHWADLLRRKGDYSGARQKIRVSIAASQQCAQRDILYLAKVSEANIELSDPKGQKEIIGKNISDAVRFSQRMGLPRLESEALYLHARLMLRQGDKMLAGTFASRSAAIANRNGLRLNKLQALRVYGIALHNRGQTETSRQTTLETFREAERRGYQSLTRGATDNAYN